ncbi:hypothetical protein F0726_02854 [Acidithiobacillus caldus]|nr:hypothetical protein F0726_02854 [Acidithiobacillus caldus]
MLAEHARPQQRVQAYQIVFAAWKVVLHRVFLQKAYGV